MIMSGWAEAAQCCGKNMPNLWCHPNFIRSRHIILYKLYNTPKVIWVNVYKGQRKRYMEKGFVNCKVLYKWQEIHVPIF